jgi:hypothetical protein
VPRLKLDTAAVTTTAVRPGLRDLRLSYADDVVAAATLDLIPSEEEQRKVLGTLAEQVGEVAAFVQLALGWIESVLPGPAPFAYEFPRIAGLETVACEYQQWLAQHAA